MSERKGGDLDICKGCGAPIYWLTSPKTHKLNPINFSPSPKGNVRIDLEYGVYLFILDQSEVPENQRFMSHFATCPKAEEFRNA